MNPATTPRSLLLVSGTTTLLVAAVTLAWLRRRRGRTGEDGDDCDGAAVPPPPALSRAELAARFPSLVAGGAGPLGAPHCELLGLYFAAGWCGDCRPVTPAVRRVLRGEGNDGAPGLPPPPEVDGAAAGGGGGAPTDRRPLRILYVSSDASAEEMAAHVPAGMDAVPFAQAAERRALKQHFGACAAREAAALGLGGTRRRHGIPTLILLEAATGRVVTERGVDHCTRPGVTAEQVLEGWRRMLQRGPAEASATGAAGSADASGVAAVGTSSSGDYSEAGDDSFDGVDMSIILNVKKGNVKAKIR